ncbi:ABC transporter [Marinobacter hydrocarbonoclasticus]|nr:ABC transporter [Marinobacter nauticus]
MKRVKVRLLAVALMALTAMLSACGKHDAAPAYISAETGQSVVPGYRLNFPFDHGAHDEFGLEWWYVTANLVDERGEHHGVQWTLFRFRGTEAPSIWGTGQGYLGHLMHESNGVHRAWQRQGRAPQVRIETQPFVAGMDHWWLRSAERDFQPLHLVASETAFALALSLTDSPIVAHGDAGFSDKSGDGVLASYYYSLPRLAVHGHIDVGDGWRAVEGQAWLDREWSSALLDDRFVGWDWMGLQLDDGQNLMLFCLLPGEEGNRHCDGSLITPEGRVISLANDVIDWTIEKRVTLDSIAYPIKWGLALPQHDISLTIETRSTDQRNMLDIVYWEGPVLIGGSHRGQGFVEMTGRSESPR